MEPLCHTGTMKAWFDLLLKGLIDGIVFQGKQIRYPMDTFLFHSRVVNYLRKYVYFFDC